MEERLKHFENKLAFETDSWDLKVSLEAGASIVVVDARSPGAYQKEQLTGGLDWWKRDGYETEGGATSIDEGREPPPQWRRIAG